MIINSTELDGVYAIENRVFHDHRGTFVKTFHNELFTANGLNTDFKESFYSVSKKGVVRGMHFQNAPDDHAKLVYVTDGEILDLIVDVRSGSPTLGRYVSLTLSAGNAKSVYIGKGFAHGFLTLTESATVVYSTTTVHSPASDTGIRWDSFGFDWGVQQPIISERDLSFPTLAQFAGKN
ncbi:dTDP-4-dehydrorhamnose 3,5-epimerase [Shewanella decolorationis]|uniref:dTDP-4-dehydrorhamnose 3,5-epimerase n=1 Tax=Shewanella decolorationis TaxID=256839 RepID=A0A5B8QVP1_9GAMM|nr:dTDP-4-dehydrorhamnose 3,5-epimerase [Shewanella decolorationis]QDZ90395.1 dTDP-4-dehydrorhamnose 3,5-epimerase [Shewanella decolorationis]